MEIRCNLGRWDASDSDYTVGASTPPYSDVRRGILEAAEGCPDFAAEPWAAKYVKPEKGGES